MKLNNRILAVGIMLAAVSVSSASAQSRSFVVQRARTTFTSTAQLETINGLSDRASGSFSVDPANLSSVSGTLSVPIASLRTGIDERDAHLHGADWLNAEAHPDATFQIASVQGARSLSANEDANLDITGRFTINGRTRTVRARVRAKWDGATGFRLRARFSIELDEYGISIPSVVQAKVANEITIQIDIRASA